ncbi:MAG: diguanylate cyclase [Planctomycetes bacterium]|nr:diguanylate cyclase [Planctomycetota bacterium]
MTPNDPQDSLADSSYDLGEILDGMPLDAGSEARELIDELRSRIETLTLERRHLRAVLANAGDAVITTDLDGKIIDWNPGAKEMFGYSATEVIGQPASMLYRHKSTPRRLMTKLSEAHEGIVRKDVRVLLKSGEKRWIGLSLSWLRNKRGETVGTIGVSKDVTERRALEERLRQLSITDSLTKLYNQSHFFHRLEIEKERSRRLGHPLALLLFDLDNFKPLNDTHGHTAGDVLLTEIGAVLMRNIRKEVDSAFRYGGDEFTVLLPGASVTAAVAFAERVRVAIGGLEGGVRASLGIAPFDRQNGAQQILQQADTSMYFAKRAGGDQIAVWDAELGAARSAVVRV